MIMFLVGRGRKISAGLALILPIATLMETVLPIPEIILNVRRELFPPFQITEFILIQIPVLIMVFFLVMRGRKISAGFLLISFSLQVVLLVLARRDTILLLIKFPAGQELWQRQRQGLTPAAGMVG